MQQRRHGLVHAVEDHFYHEVSTDHGHVMTMLRCCAAPRYALGGVPSGHGVQARTVRVRHDLMYTTINHYLEGAAPG